MPRDWRSRQRRADDARRVGNPQNFVEKMAERVNGTARGRHDEGRAEPQRLVMMVLVDRGIGRCGVVMRPDVAMNDV